MDIQRDGAIDMNVDMRESHDDDDDGRASATFKCTQLWSGFEYKKDVKN